MTLEFRQFHLRDRIAEQSIGWLNLIAGGLIGGSFLLWSVPPFFLAKNKLSHFWVQGLVLCGAITGSSVGLAIGYRLRRFEAFLNAEQQQEDEDFLHWLASNRYYIESLRENAVEMALAQQMQAALGAGVPETTNEAFLPGHPAMEYSGPSDAVTHPPSVQHPPTQSVPQPAPTPRSAKEPIHPENYIPHPEVSQPEVSHSEVFASEPTHPTEAAHPEVPRVKAPQRHLKLVKSDVVHEPPPDLEVETPEPLPPTLENSPPENPPNDKPEPIDQASKVKTIASKPVSNKSFSKLSSTSSGRSISNQSNTAQSLGSVTRIDIKTSRRPSLMPVSSSTAETNRSLSSTNTPSNHPMIPSMNTNSNETIPLGYRLSGPPEPQAPMMPGEDDPRVQEVWEQLNAPGCEWLLQLLLTKPLLIWGEQCSGKTSFAGFLALLRVIFFGHRVVVSDPHSHQNSWPQPFEVFGGEYNYSQINSQLVMYYQRLKTGTVPHTSIWDEVTQYQENCDPQLSGRFLKSVLSDVRKPPEFPILLSHGNTLSALGGGRGGIKTMQSRGLVEVNLRATRDHLGNLRPALRGNVTGLDIDVKGSPTTQPIALESWMQPGYLLELFPELVFGGFGFDRKEKPNEKSDRSALSEIG